MNNDKNSADVRVYYFERAQTIDGTEACPRHADDGRNVVSVPQALHPSFMAHRKATQVVVNEDIEKD